MNRDRPLPRFVSWVAVGLGAVDIVRGFLHTLLLEFAATNIAGLDLSTAQAGDLLQLMGAFGISNYLTGTALILVGWKARPLALAMLGAMPLAYAVGMAGVRASASRFAASAAAWGGAPMMLVYLSISAITFLAGAAILFTRSKASSRRSGS